MSDQAKDLRVEIALDHTRNPKQGVYAVQIIDYER